MVVVFWSVQCKYSITVPLRVIMDIQVQCLVSVRLSTTAMCFRRDPVHDQNKSPCQTLVPMAEMSYLSQLTSTQLKLSRPRAVKLQPTLQNQNELTALRFRVELGGSGSKTESILCRLSVELVEGKVTGDSKRKQDTDEKSLRCLKMFLSCEFSELSILNLSMVKIQNAITLFSQSFLPSDERFRVEDFSCDFARQEATPCGLCWRETEWQQNGIRARTEIRGDRRDRGEVSGKREEAVSGNWRESGLENEQVGNGTIERIINSNVVWPLRGLCQIVSRRHLRKD